MFVVLLVIIINIILLKTVLSECTEANACYHCLANKNLLATHIYKPWNHNLSALVTSILVYSDKSIYT